MQGSTPELRLDAEVREGMVQPWAVSTSEIWKSWTVVSKLSNMCGFAATEGDTYCNHKLQNATGC